MEIRLGFLGKSKTKIKELFVRKMPFSGKKEVNLAALKWMGLSFIIVFVGVVLLMPTDIPVEFSEKMETTKNTGYREPQLETPSTSPTELWASPQRRAAHESARREVNHNTPMLIRGANNARTQLHAGIRLPLRIVDKVIVSQEPVPLIAELLLQGQTESGLSLPAGTLFYGEASLTKGSKRAEVVFTKISPPSGQIRDIQAKGLGKDGHFGIAGKVRSDGVKNTAGQILTGFVGGFAAGSMQTDILGRSEGGLANGLLSAVSETAKSRAQKYGEELKTQREWLEIQAGTECDAQLSSSMNLQGGNRHE